ncbi:hypothetical protein Plhal304r1_c007g0026861 [Plasmopara halstedii]
MVGLKLRNACCWYRRQETSLGLSNRADCSRKHWRWQLRHSGKVCEPRQRGMLSALGPRLVCYLITDMERLKHHEPLVDERLKN